LVEALKGGQRPKADMPKIVFFEDNLNMSFNSLYEMKND
jgi:hypothetical protein